LGEVAEPYFLQPLPVTDVPEQSRGLILWIPIQYKLPVSLPVRPGHIIEFYHVELSPREVGDTEMRLTLDDP